MKRFLATVPMTALLLTLAILAQTSVAAVAPANGASGSRPATAAAMLARGARYAGAVPPDYTKAMQWLHEAAAAGNAGAVDLTRQV